MYQGMGAGCISAVWPFYLSRTDYLPLLGERGLHAWLLTSAWHPPPAGGEILMFPNGFLFFFIGQVHLITEFYLSSHSSQISQCLRSNSQLVLATYITMTTLPQV